MPDPADVRAHGGDMGEHHRHEKRLPRVRTRNQFSCLMYRATPASRRKERPQLLYHMEMRYCIICNAEHWFLGEKIEFVLTEFDPNQYDILELREMGYFAQFDDASGE